MIELRKTPKTPKPDPDGQNFERAQWARLAMLRFQETTQAEDGDAVSDLLCDLMHMCDYSRRDVEEFDEALARAQRNYTAETSKLVKISPSNKKEEGI